MKAIEVFKNSYAAGLLSSDGVCASSEAMKVMNDIKAAANEKGVFITYWNGGKVSFTSIYTHTINVPAKALKSLESFKSWNIDRINHYFEQDGKKSLLCH